MSHNLALRHTDEVCAANARKGTRRDPVTGQTMQPKADADKGKGEGRKRRREESAAASTGNTQKWQRQEEANEKRLQRRQRLREQQEGTEEETEPIFLQGLDDDGEEEEEGGGDGVEQEVVLQDGQVDSAEYASEGNAVIRQHFSEEFMVAALVNRKGKAGQPAEALQDLYRGMP